jgi:predicted kinase
MEGTNSYKNEGLHNASDLKGVDTLQLQQLPEWYQSLEAPSQNTFEPFVLMLMGLPGSGKSTIADTFVELEPWKYVCVNQDTLGDRHACLKLAEQVLSENKCPIIDRCHASFKNRIPFYELSKSFNVPVGIVIFDAPYTVCVQRCRERYDHPTVSSDEASKIVGCARKDWKLPGKSDNVRHVWTFSVIEDAKFPKLFRRLL